ncbi:MAG: hypothetical protein ACOC8R_01140, partial [Desulfosalsimonas sp.]
MKHATPETSASKAGFFRKTRAWGTIIIASIMVLGCGVILAPDNHEASAAETGREKTEAAPENFTELAEKAGPAVV